uniref:Uncharacterized protein n=1 Tax=Poecilia latipinna TaxID=48699 RepID=A0A3B3U274_9TELE
IHLMYAVREEVEVLKEQIKELFERNSVLERENAVLKSLANSEQLSQLCLSGAHWVSPSPQLERSPRRQQQRCRVLASLWIGLPVRPPRHLRPPVLGL